MLLQKVKALAAKQEEELQQIRRHLHANPELSYQEYETAEFVSAQLHKTGLDHIRIANTGITGILKGKKAGAGKVIALRADMDALPILEENDVPYRSGRNGVMHACGHDVHMTSLLGTLRILKELENEFAGEVKFIFQPAEECAPGGAKMMIAEGVLESPQPHRIIGQHVMPELPAGKVGFHTGHYMASADEIHITITGKGGHAAAPHQVTDPVIIACNMLVMLQQVVSRRANPLVPSVLSFGRFIADGAHNVIPDKVKIEGTFRTMNEVWRKEALQIVRDFVADYPKSMGGAGEIHIMEGYPVLINEERTTAFTRACTEEYLGKENVVDVAKWMAAEDFARYSHLVDACFYRMGVQKEADRVTPLHTSTFDADESALVTAAGLMAWVALCNLGQS